MDFEVALTISMLSLCLVTWDVMRRYFNWRPAHRDLEKKLASIERQVEEAREVAGQAATNSNILVSRYGRR